MGLIVAGMAVLSASCASASPNPRPSVPAEGSASGSRAAIRSSETRIAVLPLVNNTGVSENDGLGGSLSEAACARIKPKSGLVLVERARINEVVAELNLQRTRLADPATAVRVGRLLGAHYMVFGSFAAPGGAPLLTARLVDVETGRIVDAFAEHGESVKDFERMSAKAISDAVAAAKPGSTTLPSDNETDEDLPKASRTNPNGLGVVIGVRDYRNQDVPAAEYALDDARLMRRYLTRTMGFLPDNVIYLENPTKAELETVFGATKSREGRLAQYLRSMDKNKAEIFVYYSGHGAPGLNDHRAYLIPSDASPYFIETNGYSRDELLERVGNAGVRSATVVLESCFSGQSSGGAVVRHASPLTAKILEGARPRNVSLFTSSGGDQISSWYPEKHLSLFTYQFVVAIRERVGAGGVVTAGDLIKDIQNKVSERALRLYNRNQIPEFTGNSRLAMTAR